MDAWILVQLQRNEGKRKKAKPTPKRNTKMKRISLQPFQNKWWSTLHTILRLCWEVVGCLAQSFGHKSAGVFTRTITLVGYFEYQIKFQFNAASKWVKWIILSLFLKGLTFWSCPRGGYCHHGSPNKQVRAISQLPYRTLHREHQGPEMFGWTNTLASGFYEGLNGVNRQPSNGPKINRQPSKMEYFCRQPSNERAKISRQISQISLNDRDRLT